MWIVTGASGFVGSHVLRELGVEARGFSRADWQKLPHGLDGAAGIVHAASVVHRPDTPADEYRRFNVEATASLVDAARKVGIRRFVFISSIKVYGESPSGVIDERTPIAAELDYARTKAEAEEVVLRATELQPIVLRLSPVYGRGDKGNVRTMIRAIQRRRFLIPGDGSTRKSIVHVTTVAKAVRAATTTKASGVFVIADRETPSIRELADTMARALGRRRPIAVPRRILRAVARVVGKADLIDKATTSSLCDPSRAEHELGVDCHVDLAWAIRDEIEWLRSAGLL